MTMLVQLAKGEIVTPLTGITVTTASQPKSMRGHNALILYFLMTAGSGTWTIKIQGATAVNGTFVDMYDINGVQMAISSVTASRSQVFVGIPEHFRIVATEDVNGATITVAYETLTM
jgi:hypothetical protein